MPFYLFRLFQLTSRQLRERNIQVESHFVCHKSNAGITMAGSSHLPRENQKRLKGNEKENGKISRLFGIVRRIPHSNVSDKAKLN